MSNTSDPGYKDSTPPQVEYDRGLIADMLDALITFGDKLAGFTYRSINDQIALLRAADDRDAAGVHTAKAAPGDAEAVPSAEINALPDRIRQYIAALETEADPAGTIRQNILVREENEMLRKYIELQQAQVVGADVARLMELVYVPGAWRCPKCSLRLIASTLSMGDGGIYANNEPQECANGCGSMWRVTEREDRQEAQRFAIEQAEALTTPQSSAPVVDEVVAWAVDRDGDRTFPRIYATEAEADHMVFNVTVNPPAKKRPVIGYEAVKAALTAALGKGNNNG